MSIPHLTSGRLTAPHGFFGRRGGVSTGKVASLNASFSADDEHAHVVENRRRVQDELGAAHLVTAKQTHSAIAALIDDPASFVEADALITNRPGIALGILTADCVPILLEGPGVVGVAHAGWRGSLTGIVEATIALFEALGIGADQLTVAMGPALRSPLFEVQEDLVNEVCAQHPQAGAFFTQSSADRWDYDHARFVRWRLTECGVEDARIDDVGGNTLADPENWFSHRADGRYRPLGKGRNISTIMLPNA